jgi:hypothetical protein
MTNKKNNTEASDNGGVTAVTCLRQLGDMGLAVDTTDGPVTFTSEKPTQIVKNDVIKNTDAFRDKALFKIGEDG